jgi:DNA repair exonuclease SbcCD ATPase subunit
LEEAQNAIVSLGDKFTVGTMRIGDIEQVVKRIAEHFQNLSIEQNSITHLQEYINTYLQENENLQEHKESLKDEASKLRDMKKELRDHNKDKEKLVKTRAVFEVGARLLKDNGVKTKIIRQYIPVINKLVNKYLASMDFFVNFELNEAFHETIKSRHRDTFSYASFSEGEKQRIDLALLLTWRAVARMKNSVATNLMMLDEVFDASLDANGTEELMKILQGFDNDTNIFVISHKQEALVDKFMDTIRFMKRGNFSEIV